jgi:ankyrin repeat protein
MSSNKNKSGNKGKNSSSSREMAGSAGGSTAATTNSGKKRKVWARSVNLTSNNNNNNSDSASNVNINNNINNNNTSTAVEITSDGSGGRTVNITNPTGGKRTVNIATTTKNTSNSAQQRSNNNNNRISSVEKRTTGAGRGGTEVKISFGPSRPPTTSSSNAGGKHKHKNSSNNSNSNSNSNSNHHQHDSHFPSSSAAAAASMAAMMGAAGNGNICFGDLDMETLKENAAAATAGQKTFRNKNGLPCTEAEMKALMSMFVEIMGMSMNNNNKGGGNMMYSNSDDDSDFHQSTNGNSNSGSSQKNGCGGPVFNFGANPMDAASLAAMAAAASGSSSGMIPDHMAAATAGFFADGASWEALRRTYAAAEQMAASEDDDDDESFENRELTFEELEFLLHHRKQKEEAAKLASQFASGDWESLEQVAINDHLLSEADDKERKTMKKREKKQRRKAKLKEEAAQKVAEAAQKKGEKAIVSWRSRVVSACQSNEITKLDGLLLESPLRNLMEEEDNNNNDNETNGNYLSMSCIIPHLEFLLPNSVAKNRAHVERGIEARLRLAEYVLHSELSLAFQPLRTGRTALHTACFHGDVRFLQLLFDKIESYEPNEGETPIPSSFLNLTCDESGWSPLHYASISGSSETMELLLAKGSDLSTRTDVTHTWRESDGRGLTTRELVQYVQSGNYEEVIETHGLALQEMTNAFFNHYQDRRIFMKKLERVHQRLSNVEKNGYTPLSNAQTDSTIESELKKEDAELNRSEASSSRNKKKKKKKKQTGKEAESSTAASDVANQKNSASTQSNSIESKEEKDPLVTALLGMGFNEEQIMAAVKACGGTHRATADDLVTWILGQGENEESLRESQSASERAENTQQGRSQTDQSQTEDSLGSNKHKHHQQQQDAARQKEETARKLAAKREEARRRNREWNNREQARQEKEAKAKVAHKLCGIPRSSIPVQAPVPPPGVDVLSKNKTRPPVPNGIHTSHITGNTIAGIKSSARQPPTGNKWGVPPVTTQAHSFARPTSQSNFARSNEQQALPVSSFFTSINDDDKTVSSFGSSRCMSVSSKDVVPLASHPSVLPLGFTPSVTQPIAAHIRPAVSTVPENPSTVPFSEKLHEGEIRATAKEFVPSFTIPDSGNSDESVPSNDRSPSQSSESNDVMFPPGILPQQGGSAVSRNPLLGPSLQNSFQNSFDNTPSMIPPSTESIVTGTSFIVGSKTGEPAMTIPFGFGQGDSKESNGIGGSRLLNSISRNKSVGGTSIWGDGQNVPSLETTLQQNIPSLETTLHPSFFGDTNHHEMSDEKNTSSYWW